MKNLLIKLTILISFVVLLGSNAKADNITVSMDTIASSGDTLAYCYDDKVTFTINSNADQTRPLYWRVADVNNNDIIISFDGDHVIIQKDSITYHDGTNWTTEYINNHVFYNFWYKDISNVSHLQTFRMYFNDPTTPTTEPWTETSQAICGATDTLYAGPIGNDDNYQQGIRYVWRELGATDTIADGFYPNDTSLVVDHTASYIVDIISGCGVTSDTIYMEIVTTNLPDLGPDSSFCGTAVYYIARLTETYDSYLWSDGSTADTLIVTAPGTYPVTVNNNCLTNEVTSVTIHHESYPPLDLGPDIVACGGTSVTLNTNGFAYDIVQWKNQSDSITFNTDTNITITSNVNLLLRARQGVCSVMWDDINVTFTEPMDWTILCIATVDTNGLNKIVWNPNYSSGIESYSIYKQSGIDWVQIDNVPLDSVASWGHTQFWDTTTDPEVQATAYAVSAIDTCGNESVLSPSHTTVRAFLTEEWGTGNPILNRTDYSVSDGSFIVTNYLVLVDSFANGNITQLDVFNGTNTTYTITDPYPGAKYFAGAGLPYACSGNKSINDLSGISISNAKIITTATTTFTITTSANPTIGGNITGDGVFDEDQTANLVATTNTGYDFIDWTENGTSVSTDANYSFVVTGDRTLVANFSAITPTTFTITTSANPTIGGNITGDGVFDEAQTANLVATTNTGYDFIDWTENGTSVSTDANYSFVVTGDRTLVANFDIIDDVNNITKADISVYPNPSTGIFNIKGLDNTDYHIAVANATGQIILSTNSSKLDLSGYSKGFYFAKITTTTGQINKKLILK